MSSPNTAGSGESRSAGSSTAASVASTAPASSTATAATVAPPTAPGHRSSPARADIQALRALAMGSVVLYHLWPHRFPGGFIGVDVFFVISGFLITRQIVNELRRSGRVSLRRFWARRVRRLLPVAACVSLVCLALLLLVMPRLTWADNLHEIGAATLYVENIILSRDAVDYLAAENAPTMVQHYWSLSVEEQFYLFWPLAIVATMFLVRRASAGRLLGATPNLRRGHSTEGREHITRSLLALFALATIASFVYSCVGTAHHPATTFFNPVARAWQFGVGALLVFLPEGWAHRSARSILAWVGLAVLLLGDFLINGHRMVYPGLWALVPTLGTAAVIAAVAPARTGSPLALMRLRPIQFLGNISYSAYLWHWPLIIAGPWILHRPLTWPIKLAIMLITVGLATLSKRWIEDTTRDASWWSGSLVRVYATMVAVMLLVGGGPLVLRSHVRADIRHDVKVLDARAATPASCFGAAAIRDPACLSNAFRYSSKVDTAVAAADWSAHMDACQQSAHSPHLRLCEFGETKNPRRTVYVVGNSHSVRLVTILQQMGADRGWKIVLAGKTDCLGITAAAPGVHDSCAAWSDAVHQQILKVHPDAVVFSSYVGSRDLLAGPGATGAPVQQGRAAVQQSWNDYRRAGIPVIVVQDVPGTRPDPAPACVQLDEKKASPCTRREWDMDSTDLTAQAARASGSEVTWVPTRDLFCRDDQCHALIGGLVVYSDAHHLTTAYSRTMAPYLSGQVVPVVEH